MKVIIAGDFAPRARLAKQIDEKLFSEVFPEDLRKVIKTADFSFVNFECPIAEEGFKPIKKCGPNLQCTAAAAEAVKFAGFTGVTMANNHILDFGPEGVLKTEKCCKAIGLDVIGIGKNLDEANKALYLEKNGKKLAVINCCEQEFSIATETEAGANPLNPIRQFYSIQEAKKNADYVLVIVHGGHEHFQLPSPRMVETYRFFINAGADAVVNHHQHCYSGYEIYNGKPIFYGLGNFCFEDKKSYDTSWNQGFLVEISFESEITFSLHPYLQCNGNTSVTLLKDDTAFKNDIKKLNDIIANPKALYDSCCRFYEKQEKFFLSVYEPYGGKYLNAAFYRGWLPSFFKGKKPYITLNHIMCEAHRDKLIHLLNKKIKE